MSLIEFEDFPSTNTPINAENLNNNFNELNDYNSIKIRFSTSGNYSIPTTDANTKLPFGTIVSSHGNKLTLTANNEVKIGSGVSVIRVYAAAYFTSVHQRAATLRINKNTTAEYNANEYMAGNYQSILTPSVEIDVQENDLIWIGADGYAGDQISNAQHSTIFFVEVVR